MLETAIRSFKKRAPQGDPWDCWEWAGATNKQGYGLIWVRNDKLRLHFKAHRIAFFLWHGRWPEPMCCHHCDNPLCCNPAHLYEGTAADNNRDKIERGRDRKSKKGD